MTTLLQDLRFTVRQLRKSPGFTITAVLTLAMAIGANAVVFSVMNGLILRPLDVPQAQSLNGIERASDNDPSQSYPDYLDLRDRNHSFDGLAAYACLRWRWTRAKVHRGSGAWRRAETTLTHYRFGRISAVSSMTPMSMAPTALPISCSATHIGTAIFTMIVALWVALSS